MTSSIFLAVVCGALELGFAQFVSVRPSPYQTTEKPEAVPPLHLACSVEKPIVLEGEALVLRAWATSPRSQLPEYNWAAEAGRIVGRDHEVRWDFAGVRSNPRPHQATVKATLPSGESASCSVQVIVGEKERGTRETGRSFLVKGKNETAGYGLYSYLLLGLHPSASNREPCLKAIEAYLGAIEEVTKLEDYFPRGKLNVAYLPIEVAPVSKPSADWLIEHYDYARARALLDVLPGNLREGPYIVSVLEPLGSGSPVSHYLFQDLSAVPTKNSDLVSWWVREFLSQAAQERYWEPRTAELFVLKIRTTIGALAVGLPEVQKALDGWISWVH
jgi:hypothetical protein